MDHRVGQLANCSAIIDADGQATGSGHRDQLIRLVEYRFSSERAFVSGIVPELGTLFGIIAGKDYRSPLWDQALPESLEEQNGKPV